MDSMVDRNATDEEKQMVLDLLNDYQEVIKKKLNTPVVVKKDSDIDDSGNR